jgi:hypothetical protein
MSVERFQISVLRDIEPESKWPQMCNDPQLFMQEIAKRLFVKIDLDTFSQNIIISGSIPQSKDRGKIWVKTSWPYGIGFVANGEYQMDYAFTGYPVNTPFLSREITPSPQYVSLLGDIQLREYGMEDMQTKPGAKNRMFWYIFQPERIVV